MRLEANNRALIIHWHEYDGVCVIRFDVVENGIRKGGHLPDVEMSRREILLRHIGNRIEQIR